MKPHYPSEKLAELANAELDPKTVDLRFPRFYGHFQLHDEGIEESETRNTTGDQRESPQTRPPSILKQDNKQDETKQGVETKGENEEEKAQGEKEQGEQQHEQQADLQGEQVEQKPAEQEQAKTNDEDNDEEAAESKEFNIIKWYYDEGLPLSAPYRVCDYTKPATEYVRQNILCHDPSYFRVIAIGRTKQYGAPKPKSYGGIPAFFGCKRPERYIKSPDWIYEETKNIEDEGDWVFNAVF